MVFLELNAKQFVEPSETFTCENLLYFLLFDLIVNDGVVGFGSLPGQLEDVILAFKNLSQTFSCPLTRLLKYRNKNSNKSPSCVQKLRPLTESFRFSALNSSAAIKKHFHMYKTKQQK